MRWKESDFWKHSSPKELIDFFENLHKDDSLVEWVAHMDSDSAFAELVFEYIWICRSDERVHTFFNRREISPSLILHFIYFGLGKQFVAGNMDSSAYFVEIKKMFNSEQSLRLLSMAEAMEQDPTLKIHLLANLDPQTWEAYFDLLDQNSQTMNALLEIFSNLREKEILKILLNSPTLYYYLRMMIYSNSQDAVEKHNLDKQNLKAILESVHVWEKFCNSINAKFKMEDEKLLSPKERNANRLSSILRELVTIPSEERVDILIYIKGNGALVDEVEESTILSLLQNYDERGSFI
jgi:hypothetical protein